MTASLQPVPSGSVDLMFRSVSSGRCLRSFTGHLNLFLIGIGAKNKSVLHGFVPPQSLS